MDKPNVLSVNLDGIPEGLKRLPRWVVWRYDLRDGNYAKVLYRPNGRKSRPNDERTWVTYEAAAAAYTGGGWDGIGIALGDGLVGVDLDDCRSEAGEIAPWANTILGEAATYYEVSPSGTGYKLFAFADMEGGKGTGTAPVEGGAIEIYKGVATAEPRPEGFSAWPKKGSADAAWEQQHRAYGRWFAVTGHGNDADVCSDVGAVQRAVDLLTAARSAKGQKTRDARTVATAVGNIRNAPNGTRHNALVGGGRSLVGVLKAAGIDTATLIDTIAAEGEGIGLPPDEAQNVAEWVAEIPPDASLPPLVPPVVQAAEPPRAPALDPLPDAAPKPSKVAAALGLADKLRGITGYNADGTAQVDAHAAAQAQQWAMSAAHNTDLGNAARMVALHAGDIRHVTTWGAWLVYDGTRWQRDEVDGIYRLARSAVRQMYAQAAKIEDAAQREALVKWAMGSESAARLGAMVQLARSEDGVATHHAELDSDPWLLNCTNGTLDLRNGNLLPHDRDDLITKRVDVAYDATAPAPTWDAFIKWATCDDAALGAYLQRAAGYMLTGDTSEQCMFFLYGGGANGKSTFVEALFGLLGEYARRMPTEMIMARHGEGIPNDVAALPGARLALTGEVAQSKRLDEAKVKDITGGDTISARFMRQEWFSFKPQFKLLSFGNHKPRIIGADHGIWRRMRLIPFAATISDADKDPQLGAKLRTEAAGILAWAVRGCLAWQRDGLTPPPVVADATKEYRAEEDTVGAFIAERCYVAKDASATAAELYTAYKAWAEESGEFAISKKLLGQRLDAKDFRTEKQRTAVLRIGIGLLK